MYLLMVVRRYINEVVLKDREMLSHDGLILAVTTVDARLKSNCRSKVVLEGFMAGDTAKEVIERLFEHSRCCRRFKKSISTGMI